MYITVKNSTGPENYPLEISVDHNKTGNVHIKNFTLKLFRETDAAVDKQ